MKRALTISLTTCVVILVIAASNVQAEIPKRYTVSADGQEVTDSQTKLIWRRCAEGAALGIYGGCGQASTYTYEEALQRAAAQASSTGKAWRLPNVKELYSLVTQPRPNPIYYPYFPVLVPDCRLWSSTPRVGYDGVGPNSSWAVYFPLGRVSLVEQTGGIFSKPCAWLVRGGQ